MTRPDSTLHQGKTVKSTLTFPESVSFTITNACNLRCRMCGQWGPDGYIKNKVRAEKQMSVDIWKRLVDELSQKGTGSVLLRGGEVFLYPDIMELIRYIRSKNIFISIDTNGTLLDKFARELVSLGNIHITVSIDGPPQIHDKIRGLNGCFDSIQKNFSAIAEYEKELGKVISKSATFTISHDNYEYLMDLPDIARLLNMQTITVVPRYWLPSKASQEHEMVLLEQFGIKAFSCSGFEEEDPGIDKERLIRQLQKFRNKLGEIRSFPYMELSDEEYSEWFDSYYTIIGSSSCSNAERLLDIQPNGDVNCCVDFPDVVFGNVKDSTIEEIWNGEKRKGFIELRRKSMLPACYRCGAKYMAEIPDKI